MELIVLRSTRAGHRRVHLGRFATLAIAAALFASGAGLFRLGYVSAPRVEDPRNALYAAAFAAEVAALHGHVDEATDDAERHLDALALQVGDLEARLVRIDALGGRLVSMAGLDDSEFQFDEVPAMGGPDPGAAASAQEVPDFLASLSSLSSRLEDRAPKLTAVERTLMDRRLETEVRPGGRPIESGWLSSRFGWRTDPVTGRRARHQGLDFAGRKGSKVLAVASGVVVFAGRRRGFGNVVEIPHGGGFTTRYAHNDKNLVKVGETVRRGEVIAHMGSSGRATGPHVHFEVRVDGKAVDPMTYIRRP